MDPERPFALAVPSYERLGIAGPYFGDCVWKALIAHSREFAYVPVEVSPFPDGSQKVRVGENVRGKTVYVIHSLYAAPSDHVMIGGQIIDALKRSDSAEVYLIDLYNPYFRQDSRWGREPVTARLVGDWYDRAGADGIFTADPHSKQLVGFSRKLEGLPMSVVIAAYIKKSGRYDLGRAVVAAPDEGGFKRAEEFANALGLPLIAVHKQRGGDGVAVKAVIGDPDGKDVFIRDDIIGTGATIVESSRALKERGARDVYACTTHLGLYGDCLDSLAAEGIPVIGTNTAPVSIPDVHRARVDLIDISPLVAEIIVRKSKGQSISRYFEEGVEQVVGISGDGQ